MLPDLKLGEKGHVNLHTIIRERVLNVKDYGAVGDGVTDDTDAIKTGLAATGYDCLVFPRGTYAISSVLDIPKGITIIGSNLLGTTIIALNEMVSMLRFTGDGYNQIISLSVDGDNKAENGFDFDTNASNNYLEFARAQKCTNAGLYMHNGGWLNAFSRCRFVYNQRGLLVESSDAAQSNHNIFDNCGFNHNIGAGAKLISGVGHKFINCDIEGNCTGGVEQYGLIQSGHSQTLSISGCHFEVNGTGEGINIRVGDTDVNSNCVLIENTYFYGGKSGETAGACNYGIELENCAATRVIGCRSGAHNIKELNLLGLNSNLVSTPNYFDTP